MMSSYDISAPPSRLETSLICIVLAAFVGIHVYALRTVTLGDSANSRLAAVYSLVHDHTWRIDRPASSPPNPFEPFTVDKVKIGEGLYSSKPPVLTLILAAQYSVCYHLLGLSLDVRSDLKRIVQGMILTTSLIPFTLALFFFWRSLCRLVTRAPMRIYLTAALALGSPLFAYAPHLTNHVPAAACYVFAAYCSVRLSTGTETSGSVVWFLLGIFSGLVFSLDLPLTALLLPLWLVPWLKRPVEKAVLFGIAGGALIAITHFLAMYLSTGRLLPVQMDQSLYLFENSYWRHPGGRDALHEPKGVYLFHTLFGRYGLFLLFPTTLLFWGSVGLAFFRKTRKLETVWILTAVAAILVFWTYYVLKTNNYGGNAYGFRWATAAAPFFLLGGVPLCNRGRGRVFFAICGLFLLIAAYSSWEAWLDPWEANREWTVRWIFGPPC